ncbi:uncharacterized protein LOC118491661 [Helianthus annuus]|uniref:uncharacterized protein LOC118491661 n=1 Tax=Helianthus annuus TaxID=4232 RepID=UPI00165318E0|nr:uncharacterized protein LOC118491661 [Helianthus annuus]
MPEVFMSTVEDRKLEDIKQVEYGLEGYFKFGVGCSFIMWTIQVWISQILLIDMDTHNMIYKMMIVKGIEQVRQQGEYESLHRVNIGFGTWEFDPTEIENPFTENEEFVHIWQGDEDILVPVTLQQNIAQQLPWIKYHELTSVGHMFPYAEGNSDAILKALLLGQS